VRQDAMRTRSNIGKHELIGLDMEVLSATDKKLVGTKGTIVDETRNMLIMIIRTDKDPEMKNRKEIKIQKKGTTIRLKLEDGPDGRPGLVDLDCDKVMFRPEDRIKRVRK